MYHCDCCDADIETPRPTKRHNWCGTCPVCGWQVYYVPTAEELASEKAAIRREHLQERAGTATTPHPGPPGIRVIGTRPYRRRRAFRAD